MLRSNRRFFPAAVFSAAVLVAMSSQEQASGADDSKAQQPAKPMMKKEPMAGEMKKDGMMKEDVSRAARKWDQKMQESMNNSKAAKSDEMRSRKGNR